MNSLKTVLLLGALSGLLLFGGELIGGRNGLEIGLLLAAGMNFVSYFFSDKLALMSSAQPVTPQENPEVYARVFPLVHNLTPLLQRAQRKARRSSLVFLGDSKSKIGTIFSRLILEGEINNVDVIGSSGV